MPPNGLDLLEGLDLDTAYRDVADVVYRLAELEQALTRGVPSRLGVFVTAYRCITLELQRRLDHDRTAAAATRYFKDPIWTGAYLVEFANRYRVALAAYKREQTAPPVSVPWCLAFDEAIAGNTVVLQDLLLGINAHINHDLPLALVSVGIEPKEQHHADHQAVNDALRATTNTVVERLSQLYGSFLEVLYRAGGYWDEKITNFSFERARAHAWDCGVGLADGRITQRQIEDQAAVVGRAILAVNYTAPEVSSVMRWLESVWVWMFPEANDSPSARGPNIAGKGTPRSRFLCRGRGGPHRKRR